LECDVLFFCDRGVRFAVGAERVGRSLEASANFSVVSSSKEPCCLRASAPGPSRGRPRGTGFDRDILEEAAHQGGRRLHRVTNGDKLPIDRLRPHRQGATTAAERRARIYDPRRAQIYEPSASPRVATVAWTTDRCWPGQHPSEAILGTIGSEPSWPSASRVPDAARGARVSELTCRAGSHPRRSPLRSDGGRGPRTSSSRRGTSLTSSSCGGTGQAADHLDSR